MLPAASANWGEPVNPAPWSSTRGRPSTSTTTWTPSSSWPIPRPILGVERFVLDDGWFRGRRDDKAGLGDWYVDEYTLAGRPYAADEGRDLPRHGIGLWVEPK